MADQDELRQRKDADGIRCRTRSARTASTSTRRPTRRRQLENAAAYLELHIEQGPVLESMDLPLGVVLGTFGVERHQVTFRGQAAHAGSTPMDQRRDALAAAGLLALEICDDRRAGRRRLHDGQRRHEARHRHLGRRDRRVPARPAPPRRGQARLDARSGEDGGVERSPSERNVEVEWERVWHIEPILFDDELIELADEAIREVAGDVAPPAERPAPRRRRGLRAGVPTVMLFVQSLRGLSHTKLEDTKEEHLELAVQALDRLATKTIERM